MAHYHLFIFAGQSNMAGFGGVGDLPTASEDAPNAEYTIAPLSGVLWQHYYGNGLLDEWVSYPKTNVYGPELSFLCKVVAAHPDWNIAGVKCGLGGTNIDFWINDPEGFGRIEQLCLEAEARLTAAGHTFEYAGFVWAQGESNAMSVYGNVIDLPNGDSFMTKTRQLLSMVRGISAKTASVPVVISRTSDNIVSEAAMAIWTNPVNNTEGWTAEQYQASYERHRYHQETVASDENNTLASMDGLDNRDDGTEYLHYTDPGYLADGERDHASWSSAFDAPVAHRVLRISAGEGILRIRVG